MNSAIFLGAILHFYILFRVAYTLGKTRQACETVARELKRRRKHKKQATPIPPQARQ